MLTWHTRRSHDIVYILFYPQSFQQSTIVYLGNSWSFFVKVVCVLSWSSHSVSARRLSAAIVCSYYTWTHQWRRSVISLGGSRPEVTSLPPPILLSFLPSRGLCMGLSRACSPAAKHFHAIYANSLKISTLMFNVLPGTDISMHAQFSHCWQNWYYGLQATYSSMALKSAGSCTFGPPHCQKVGGQDPSGLPPLELMKDV